MVDCRLCRHHYTIYKDEIDEEEKILVCVERKIIIDKEYVIDGPCENYVDVDGYDPRE